MSNLPVLPTIKELVKNSFIVGTGKHAHDKKLEDRNCVNADLGLHILNRAFEICEQNKIVQGQLFS